MGNDLVRPCFLWLIEQAVTVFSLNPMYNAQYRSPKAARIDWRRLIQNTQSGVTPGLTPPWLVFDIGRHVPVDGWSIDMATWYLPVDMWYCNSLANTTLEEQEILVQNYRDILLPGAQDYATNPPPFFVDGLPEMDSTPNNEANRIFIDSNYPLLATQLSFRLLVAETIRGPQPQAYM